MRWLGLFYRGLGKVCVHTDCVLARGCRNVVVYGTMTCVLLWAVCGDWGEPQGAGGWVCGQGVY